MADLGSINVKIGAVTKGLETGLAKARNKLSNFGNQVKQIGKVMAGVSAAVGTAGAAIVGLTTVSANAAREIRTLSRVAGATPEALQRMAFAARTVNVEQEKLADILKDTQDRVGDFIQTGGGPMADFFENIAPKIGMTAKEFQNLSGPEALQKFYNGLERSNLSMSEQIFHMEAMASDASRLIPLLRDNGAGFEEMAKQADRLGIVMSDIEVEQLAKTGDAIAEIGGLFRAAGNEIALKFSPMIEEATKLIKEQIIEAGGVADIIGGAFAKVTAIIGRMADFLSHSLNGFRLVRRELLEFKNTATNVSQAINDALGKISPSHRRQALIDEAVIMQTEQQIDYLSEKIQAFATEPLPSEAFEDWLARIEEKSKEAAVRLAEQRKALMGGVGGGQFGEDGNPINVAELEAMEQELEAFRESLRNREESEIESHERRLEELALFLENRLITETDYNKLLEAEKQRHENKIKDIYETARNREISFEQQSMKRKAQIIAGELKGISQGVAQHNKAMFRINQVAAIAEATINTYKGVSQTLAAYPQPLAGILAAGHLAAGLAQVSAIKSTSFSGGGGAAPSTVGTTAAQPVSNVGSGGGQSTNRLDVTLSGVSEDQLFSGTQIRGLINRINDELDDGAVIGNLRFQ